MAVRTGVAVSGADMGEPAEPTVPAGSRTLRVLCVESDLDHGHEVQLQLAQNGVQVTVSGDGAEGLLRAGLVRPDLALVSADITGLPARRLVELLRQTLEIPVIVGVGPGESDLAIQAMAANPTACVPRPYDINVLLPLIRSAEHTTPDRPTELETLRAGPLTLNPASHQAWLSGQPLPLPRREFQLLAYLMRNVGRVVSRIELQHEIWNSEEGFADNTITVHVRRLRRRLHSDGAADTVLIETVRGVGYRLDVIPN